jgi:hypothetical protein
LFIFDIEERKTVFSKSSGYSTNRVVITPTAINAVTKPDNFIVSVFSLIASIIGASIVTLPYLGAKNGIIIASVMIIFGAALSMYVSLLLVR